MHTGVKMYTCLCVMTAWLKRFYIRPSQRVSEINLFCFSGNTITCTSMMECLVFRGIRLPVCWGIMTVLVLCNIISIIYKCFVWCAAICYCYCLIIKGFFVEISISLLIITSLKFQPFCIYYTWTVFRSTLS